MFLVACNGVAGLDDLVAVECTGGRCGDGGAGIVVPDAAVVDARAPDAAADATRDAPDGD